MAFDPSIPLQVKTPEPVSPISSIGALMQLRNMSSQLALRNAQTSEYEAQAALRQRNLASYNTVQQLLKNPEVQKKVGAGDYSPIWNAGVSPDVGQQVIGNLQGMQSKAQELAKEKAEQYASGRTVLAQGIQGLDPTNDATAAEQWNSLKTNLAADHPELAQNLPTLSPGAGFRQQLADIQASNGIAHAILVNQSALAKTQAETSEASSRGAQAQAGAEKQQLINQAMKDALANPQSGELAIDKAFPAELDPQINASYKAAYNSMIRAGNPEGAAQIVGTAAGHAADFQKQTNPTLRAAGAATAAAKAQAEVPAHVRQAALEAPIHVQEQVQSEVQKARLSPDAFSGIVDPRARQAAEVQYQKDSQEYAQKVSAAQQIKDYVLAAQSGNKAAPALIPIEELRGLVNRVNRQELQQISGGGSLLDRIEGKLNSIGKGQPIAPDVLSDISKLADVTQQAARRNYEYNVQINNQTHGGKVQPIDLNSSGPVSVQAPNGKTYRFNNQSDANEFKKAAGIQ